MDRETHREPPARVLVAICHNLPVVQTKATRSLLEIGFGDRIPRLKAELQIAEICLAWYDMFPRVDTLRDRALEQALRDGFTHVFFLDADMIFPTDLLARLLRHMRHGAIVSGFYTQKHPPYAPIAMRQAYLHESGRYTIYHYDSDYAQVDADGLRDEDAVGMGCTLIPLSIVQAIGPRPWFEYKLDEHDWPLVSEDMAFCERVKAAGFRIAIDPSIGCGHLFTEAADERYWHRYQASMARTQEKIEATVKVSRIEHVADGILAERDAAAAGKGR